MSISRLKGSPSLTLTKPSTGEVTKYNVSTFNSPLINLSNYGEWRIVPNTTLYAELHVWGAGGCGDDGGGGGGGYSTGIWKFEPGITYIVWVGEGGQTYARRTLMFGNGGYSGPSGYGGGGGGLSGMFKNSAIQANSIIIAGGGGAAWGNGGNASYKAGAGGGTNGQNAAGGGGLGGTQNSGGAGALEGGSVTGNTYGSGGGGGYYGGNSYGSNTGSTAVRGGGGGSGYIHPALIGGTTTAGSESTPGNSGSSLRGTSGNGANTTGLNLPGNDGRFVLIPVPTPR